MSHNAPSTLSFACALTCLALALLNARLSRAPGSTHFRYSAAASLAGSWFCLGQALLIGGFGTTITVWATRMTLAAACLHQAGWLRFLVAWTRRAPTLFERVLFVSCLVAAVAVLVPGVGAGDEPTARSLTGIGTVISYPEPRAGGLLSIGLSIAVQIHIVRSALLSTRETPRARALVAAFLLLLLLAFVDGSIVSLRLPFPLVSSFGMAAVSVGLGTVMVEAAIETARTLDVKTSELEHARGELEERRRLASLGELAAVVAHEVRNPLAVVFNAVAGLRRLSARGEDEVILVDVIDEEANRLKRLVETLLDSVRPFEPQVAPHEIATLAEAAVALATRRDERERVEVSIDATAPHGATLVCDDVLVVQALSNLVWNALDAPGRKKPVVFRVTASAGERGVVRFEVSDDGEGVADTDLERIFSPFFTTRATGTGLGLTLVKRIAEAHRGVAFHEAPPEGGARFVVELPARSGR